MERKLASIRRIKEIIPIKNADLIELAKIDGWQCVVKKNEFKVGDLCVYFEIDSFLPELPQYEFLRKNCFRKNDNLGSGFLIKTVRLRGELSQGLALPVITENRNPDRLMYFIDGADGKVHSVNEGDDVTEILNVKKYELPIPINMQGDIVGYFPKFIPKTDLMRVQNIYDKFYEWMENNLKHKEFEVTTKYDGSSITIYRKDGYIGVCSRNIDLKENNNNVFWKTVNDLNLKNIFDYFPPEKNIAFQGELCGPGIQKNPLGLEKHEIVFFNIFDIDEQMYLNSYKRGATLMMIYNKHNKNINKKSYYEFYSVDFNEEKLSLEDLLEMADNVKYQNNKQAEGIVFKSYEKPDFMFKVISNKYLLNDNT